jgi:hypothetical protein
MASLARMRPSISKIRQCPNGNSTSTLCLRTASKSPMPRTSPRQSRTPKSVFRYRFFSLAHCSFVKSSGRSGLERCTGCSPLSAFCMRFKLPSLNRQQMSTSRVTRVAPWATAANPPIKTNSTCASTSLRVSSLRFCTGLRHGCPQHIGQAQGIVIGQHPLPYGFGKALLKQRVINSVLRDRALGVRCAGMTAFHCRLI